MIPAVNSSHVCFARPEAARERLTGFVHWHNVEHRHSVVGDGTPSQRHAGEDHTVLAARHEVYTGALATKPRR